MDDEIYDALKPYANQASRDEFFRGTLGKIDPSTGVVQFADPGKAGNVWVLNPQTNTYVSAFLDGAPPQVSIPVMVRKHPYHGQWIVDSVYHPDMPTYAGAGNPPPVSVPPTPTGPGTGRNQPISASLLLPGMVTPSLIAPLSVSIYQFNYVWGGQKFFLPTTEFDLTSYIPASANTHGWVLVGVDPTSNTATALAGATYPLATVLTQATVNLVSLTNKLPLFAVALYNGQTALSNVEGTGGNPGTFADCRPLIAYDNSYLQSIGVTAPIVNTGTALNPIIGLSTPLDVIYGGTKLATLTAHAAMIGNGTSAPVFLSPGSAGQFMRSNATDWLSANIINSDLPTSGVSAGSYTNTSLTVNAQGIVTAASSGSAPVTSIGVTAPITSTGGTTPTIGLSTPLAVQFGGSGSVSLAAHAMLIGNGTSAIATLAPGTSAQVAISDGIDWGSRLLIAADLPNTAVTSGSYTNTNLTVDAQGRITAASNGSVGTGTVTSITAGTGLTGGVITTTGTIALSVPVSVANGGTGLTAAGAAQNALFSNGSIWTSRVIDAGDVQTGVFANARVNWAAPGTLGSTTPNTVAATTLTVAQAAATGSPASEVVFTGAAHTALTASTEYTDLKFDLSASKQFATGALATQRAIRILAPTYTAIGASTITKAATLSISSYPIAGSNISITGQYALDVEVGHVNIAGSLNLGGGIGALNAASVNGILTAKVGAVGFIQLGTPGAQPGIIFFGTGAINSARYNLIYDASSDTFSIDAGNSNQTRMIIGNRFVSGTACLNVFPQATTLIGQITKAFSSSSTADLHQWQISTGTVAASVSATGVGAFTPITTNTGSITNALIIGNALTTANDATNNKGVGLLFRVADSTTAIAATDNISRIRNWWTNATNTANTLAMQGALSGYWNSAGTITERDVMQWGVSGLGAALWSVFSVTTPIAQPASTVALGLAMSNLGLRAAGAPSLELLSAYNGDTLGGNGLVSNVGLSVHRINQTASIGSTAIFTPPTSGDYMVTIALYDTTASGISVATVSATVTWTDPNGAQTFQTANLPVSALGNTTNVITFYATTGSAISFFTTVTGAILTAQYQIEINVLRIS